MQLFIASVALLGFLAAFQAHDRRFSSMAAFAAGPHRGDTPHGLSPETSGNEDGFSGSFSARQTARNLGY